MVHRIGLYALVTGGVLALAGLLLGFGFMFAGRDGFAKLFLAAVPMGFVLGFLGIVMTLLNPPDTGD